LGKNIFLFLLKDYFGVQFSNNMT